MRLLHRLGYYFQSFLEIIFNFKKWPSVLVSLLRSGDHGTQRIFLRRMAVQFITRGGMDIWAIKETFLDTFYTRYGVPIRDGWKVIDVGAGIGDFAIYAAYGNPNTMVYAYEPFLDSYQLLVRNINLNGFENVQPINAAVWGHEGSLLLDTSSGEPLQIMSKDSRDDHQKSEGVEVKATTLEKIFAMHDIDNLDLLKLDCEGAEYTILMNTSQEVLMKIARIIMEYHDIDSKQNHQQLALFLQEMGYSVSCYDNFVHEDIGYLFASR